ncbi:MAG TPA: efflux RND transporter periplasmic adaptor subunit [Acidobacteriaceae bacterium]|jgi:multidrug efflux pump subunit AcrA (membrane-fusion protein)|nr:efflux RND transporter periplasmic adaptor subunit [Acidobacteriaceae bacterium]
MNAKSWNSMHELSGNRMLICLIVPVVCAGLLAGCSGNEKTPIPVVSVQTATAQRVALPVVVTGEAILASLQQAILASKISAPVEKFYVQRGDRVRKGELLATLENQDLQGAALGSAGQYQQAKAQYATTTQSTIPQEVQRARLDLAQTKAEVDLQQRIYESREQLFKQGALPGRDVDQAKVALVQAQTQYDVARRHLEALEQVSRKAELSSATGQLHQAEGQYQQAQAMLSYSEIRSPIDGYVADRPLYAGEMAPAGTPVVTVMDVDVLVAKAHLPQVEVQGLPVGAPARVFVPGLKDAVSGKVMLVSPALDPGSTTVEVWVRVENKDKSLKPGTPVHVAVNARTIPDALVIPVSALVQDEGGGKHVMVVGAYNVAHRQEVTVGVEANGLMQILSGIHAGMQIITVGSYAMDDGTHVKVVHANGSSD